MTQFNSDTPDKPLSVKNISTQDLLDFGIEHVAYVRPIIMMERRVFAIHAADGTPISVVENEVQALQAIAQRDLDAVRVH